MLFLNLTPTKHIGMYHVWTHKIIPIYPPYKKKQNFVCKAYIIILDSETKAILIVTILENKYIKIAYKLLSVKVAL